MSGYPCDQCDYKATVKNDLLRHIKSRHEGVKYPCNQCDYKATQNTYLLTHIKSKHKGVKYPCDQCVPAKKKFFFFENLFSCIKRKLLKRGGILFLAS